jgi:hypothetical protein
LVSTVLRIATMYSSRNSALLARRVLLLAPLLSALLLLQVVLALVLVLVLVLALLLLTELELLVSVSGFKKVKTCSSRRIQARARDCRPGELVKREGVRFL